MGKRNKYLDFLSSVPCRFQYRPTKIGKAWNLLRENPDICYLHNRNYAISGERSAACMAWNWGFAKIT